MPPYKLLFTQASNGSPCPDDIVLTINYDNVIIQYKSSKGCQFGCFTIPNPFFQRIKQILEYLNCKICISKIYQKYTNLSFLQENFKVSFIFGTNVYWGLI